MINPKYRKALQKDLDIIYNFEKEYIKEIEADKFEDWIKAKSSIEMQLLNSLKKMYVAEFDGELIGHCFWDMHKNEPHIFSIFISKKFRKQGIATKLIGFVECEILKSNYKICKLSTMKHNPAKNLFEKLNYNVIEQRDCWLVFDKIL